MLCSESSLKHRESRVATPTPADSVNKLVWMKPLLSICQSLQQRDNLSKNPSHRLQHMSWPLSRIREPACRHVFIPSLFNCWIIYSTNINGAPIWIKRCKESGGWIDMGCIPTWLSDHIRGWKGGFEQRVLSRKWHDDNCLAWAWALSQRISPPCWLPAPRKEKRQLSSLFTEWLRGRPVLSESGFRTYYLC